MTIGSKQQQISCKCSKNAVIASQCAHWRGNPFPFTRVVFTETLRKSQRLGCGLPRRFAPRNDSAGRNPLIKIHMLIKTDNHNWDLSSSFGLQKAKAFPLRGRPRAASLAPSGQFTSRWPPEGRSDEVEKFTNSPETPSKRSIFLHTSSVALEGDSFPSRGSLGRSRAKATHLQLPISRFAEKFWIQNGLERF